MYSGSRKRSEQGGASEQVSVAGKRANGHASGPVLTTGFLIDLAHCVAVAAPIVAFVVAPTVTLVVMSAPLAMVFLSSVPAPISTAWRRC